MELKVRKDIPYPFKLIKYMGLYGWDERVTKIVGGALSTLILFLLVTITMQIVHSENMPDLADNIGALFAYAQAFLKLVIYMYNRKKLDALFKGMQYFWSISNCPEEEQVRLRRLAAWVLLIQKLFFYSTISIAVGLPVAFLFGEPLPLGAYTLPQHKELFYCVVFAQFGAIVPSAFFIIGYDGVFLETAAEIITQFRVLRSVMQQRRTVSETSLEVDYDVLKMVIKQHQHLLEFVQLSQSLYSSTLLVQCLTVSPIYCMTIFSLTNSANFVRFVTESIKSFCELIQLAYYCLPADYVTEEASLVSDTIYGSNWYTRPSAILRCPITFMIQRSQRKIAFRAGGFIDFNAGTLLTVIKVSWSACTVFSKMGEK